MPTPPPISGDNTLGPYHLLCRLGEGGMGTVYLAHDPALDRRVALKVLRLPAAEARVTATLARRFLREARSAARINHPHVVTVYAVGEHANKPYLVMEYVEGGSLADALRREGPMPWRDATAAVRDALRALAASHARGVIHRDIKPANLMRARDTEGREIVKLVDFGLARVVTDGPADADLTFPGAFVGSPSYASPEQAAGASLIDGRADLYALAATWFALLSGQPPFVDDDPADVLERHLHTPFPDVRALARGIPADLVHVLERASRKRPDDRYPTAAAMLVAVEALLALPADIVADAQPRRPRKAPRLPTETPPPSAHAPTGSSDPAHETVAELETRLARARACRDSSTQLQTLRTLYGLYAKLNRGTEAQRAFREALVLHVKLNAPAICDN
jgi:serine/threonine protein kinase